MTNTKEKKIRNWMAVEAFQKSGAGKHGKSKKARSKANRKAAKRGHGEGW